MEAEEVRLFYSYSHKDKLLRDALETHLAILKRQKILSDWCDREIIPGKEWELEIDVHINKADIILLLISPDFIASDYCYGKELCRALERYESGKVRVIPIIIRPTDWTKAPFAMLQALPVDGKPITTWVNHDEAWLDVTKGIRKVIEEIIIRKTELSLHNDFIKGSDLLVNELNRIDSIYDKKIRLSGFPTGFVDLDRKLDGLHISDIILVAGRHLMGKLNFVLNIASYFISEISVPVCILSTRINPEQIYRKLLVQRSKIPIHGFIRGMFQDNDWYKLDHAIKKMVDSLLFIYYSPKMTDVELAERISTLKKSEGIGLVIIDKVEDIDSTQNHNTINGEVKTIVKTIKKIAVNEKIPVLVTTNISNKIDSRMDKRPILRDLEEWEFLAEMANGVMFLYREDFYDIDTDNKNIAELIVVKNEYGPTGIVDLFYQDEYCSFVSLERLRKDFE